ncbi:hypothetical protein AJ80_01033 [Polytolypa hystricis UAMH7299]|uniref:SsuA/THI5-like domain-containing protein n=1 Tax=Polytolypa hystricis (strain UAMH7299) TaxID=1447883 RepID=A0A2B7Z265_POLH7|nr:hypothetical protein AJ80_01033 [Polytolypa hystricis UAMH7299]
MKQSILFVNLALLLPNVFVSGLKIASSLTTIEYTPEVIAIEDYYTGTASVVSGGAGSLFSDSTVDLASNAETQALRQFSVHNDLRIIYTIAQVHYRLVANKMKGINTLADLQGRTIGAIPATSSAYFVYKYLQTIGLDENDYTVIFGNECFAEPCAADTLPGMLAAGTVDAVGIWEPTLELAIRAIGNKAKVFDGQNAYREIFSLHTTTAKLADPVKRQEIVDFLQALNQAEQMFQNDPESVWPRVSNLLGVSESVLESVWPIHNFTSNIPDDLEDILIGEEQWIAAVDGRAPVPAAQLQNIVDRSLLDEVFPPVP